MKRPLLSFVAVVATALSLAACDARKLPGEDPQREGSFDEAPPATATITDADSVNQEQTVMAPIGKGSSGDTAQSAASDINSAPSGSSATTPQNASGTPGEISNATSSKGGAAPTKNNQ